MTNRPYQPNLYVSMCIQGIADQDFCASSNRPLAVSINVFDGIEMTYSFLKICSDVRLSSQPMTVRKSIILYK